MPRMSCSLHQTRRLRMRQKIVPTIAFLTLLPSSLFAQPTLRFDTIVTPKTVERTIETIIAWTSPATTPVDGEELESSIAPDMNRLVLDEGLTRIGAACGLMVMGESENLKPWTQVLKNRVIRLVRNHLKRPENLRAAYRQFKPLIIRT